MKQAMRKSCVITAVILLVVSCSDDYSYLNDYASLEENYQKVLFERDSDWIPYRPIRTRSDGRIVINNNELLGYSFKTDYLPIVDLRNLGYKVIDVNKINELNPEYIQSYKILNRDAKCFSFSNFDQYIDKSTFTRKVHHGLDFDFFGLHFGHKKEYTSTFGLDINSTANNVFGETNIVVRDSTHRIKNTSSVLNKIKKSCIYEDFIEVIHTMHPSEIVNLYGCFVNIGYSTGCQATAIYKGHVAQGVVVDNIILI